MTCLGLGGSVETEPVENFLLVAPVAADEVVAVPDEVDGPGCR